MKSLFLLAGVLSLAAMSLWAGAEELSTPTTEPSTLVPQPSTQPDLDLLPLPAACVGCPKDMIPGSTRTDIAGKFAVFIFPIGEARTTRTQPTFYWYINQPTKYDVDIVVMEVGAENHLLKRTLVGPKSQGFHAVDLTQVLPGENPVKLEYGKRYWVKVMVWLWNESDKNPYSEAIVSPIKAPDLATGLADQKTYAKAGFWYDAFDAVSQKIAKDSANAQLIRQRISLLSQVGACKATLNTGESLRSVIATEKNTIDFLPQLIELETRK